MKTRIFLGFAAALAFLLASSAWAQYPERPIRVVIPFPAGGSFDTITRAITAPMAQMLGQPIVVDARPGADGVIAGDFVAKAAPDGYTLLLGSATGFSYAPAKRKSLPYDPVADFTPIGRVVDFGFFLFTAPSLPVRNLAELVVHLKANPTHLNHGSTSSSALLVSIMFARAQNLEFAQVPYKGDAQLFPDLLTGRIDFSFAPASLMPYVKEGKLRVLATTLPTRSPLAPDAPTLAEAGLDPLPIESWVAFFGPARMPRDVVMRINAALNAALARPEVRESMARMATQARPSTPEELAVLVKDQLAAWRRAAQSAGIQPE